MYRMGNGQHPSLKAFHEAIKDYPTITMEEANKIEITNEELQKHNTDNDAWVSYDGYVYDVSEYVRYHPAGAGCFQSYYGYDISKVTRAIHGHVKIIDFIKPCIKGRLIDPPINPANKKLRVERGQL